MAYGYPATSTGAVALTKVQGPHASAKAATGLPSPSWRGAGGVGLAGREPPSSRPPFTTRRGQSPRPTPPTPLHHGEGRPAAAFTGGRECLISVNPIAL